MRPGPNSRRLRGRGSGPRRSGPGRSQNFDSNGPDVKVRGSAQQVVDKYLVLAREATTAGNPVMAEAYYQHAEHYFRVQSANNAANAAAANNGSSSHAGDQGGNGREQPAYEPDRPADGANGDNGAAEKVVEAVPAVAPQPAIESAPEPAAESGPEPSAEAASERSAPRRRRSRNRDSGPAKEPIEPPN